MSQKKQEQLSTGVLTGLSRISRGTTFTGDVSSDGDFRIDGTMNGNITTTGRIVVGSGAEVYGDVKCLAAEIEGVVEGKLDVEDVLSVKSTGVIRGELATSRIAVELGAVLDVQSCKMKKENK